MLAGVENLTGSAFDDVLAGRAMANAFVGGDGIDLVDFYGYAAGAIASLTTGIATGAGSDTLAGIERLSGSAHNDVLVGDGGPNQIDGTAGNDSLDGVAGNDVLVGGVGNDTLRGRTGNDALHGQDGVDAATFSVSATAVTASLMTNTASGEGSDTFNTIENLIGTPLNDSLVGDSAANRLDGTAGNDSINAGAGNDTMTGGPNTDSCNGGAGRHAATCETVLGVLTGPSRCRRRAGFRRCSAHPTPAPHLRSS